MAYVHLSSIFAIKQVPNHPGYYVTPDGRVFSGLQLGNPTSPHGGGLRSDGMVRELKQCVDSHNYFYVRMYLHKGYSKAFRIHQLVLRTFVGEPPQGYECRHLDGNRQNNNLGNLKWGTPKENTHDNIVNKTLPRGERIGSSKLTESDVLHIRTRFLRGEYQRVIASEYGITQGHVSSICSKEDWKHI